MELVYCYIKKYKNLEDIELNFSPKHKFKMEKKNSEGDFYELTEEKVENKQPNNFFGKNTSNITGIIGQNGTGKSNILEVLFYETIDKLRTPLGNQRHATVHKVKFNFYEFLFIYKDNKGIHYFSTMNSKVTPSNIKPTRHIEDLKPFFTRSKKFGIIKIDDVFKTYNFHNDYLSTQVFKDKYKNTKIDYSLQTCLSNDIHSYHNKNLSDVLFFILKSNNLKKLKITEPKKMILSLKYDNGINNLDDIYNNLTEDFLDKIEIEKKDFNRTRLEKSIKNSLNPILNTSFYPKNSTEYNKIWKKNERSIETLFKEILSYNDIKNLIEDFKFKILKDTENFEEQFKEIIYFYVYIYYPMKNNYYKNFTFKDSKIFINLDSNSNFDCKFFLSFLNKVTHHNILFNFDINLSSGEWSLYTLFAKTYNIFYSQFKDKKDFLILIDEPENLSHPEWQRQILYYLLKFINSSKKERNVQLILTSHSPYLVSDLPSENLILLKKDEETGKAVVAENNILTFASNIYDLQSSSFFMESNLGEFSRQKIKNIIDELNSNKEISKERKKEIKYIIDSIGEELIKNRLLNMYEEKFKSKNKIYNFINNLNEEEMKKLKEELSDSND